MKAIKILIALIVVAGVGVGAHFFWRQHHSASAPPAAEKEAENAPTLVSVQVGPLKRMTLHRYFSAYGTVEPAPATATEPAAATHLASAVAGVVARVNVFEGQRIKKGDVIVELDSSAMTIHYAKEEVARQKKLYEQQNTSLRNLQNAEEQLALLRVKAPMSGIVTRVNVAPGAAVDVSTVLAEAVDLGRLTVRADVPAADVGGLQTGEDVQTLSVPPVTGTVSFVSPFVDTNNGSVAVRVQLPGESQVRPGQFVELQITTGTHTNCLAAPAKSVVTDLDGHSVISLVKGDEATQIQVKTGYREDDWVEVEAPGLKAGDQVVTVGAYGLPEKTKIEVTSAPADTNGPATNSAP